MISNSAISAVKTILLWLCKNKKTFLITRLQVHQISYWINLTRCSDALSTIGEVPLYGWPLVWLVLIWPICSVILCWKFTLKERALEAISYKNDREEYLLNSEMMHSDWLKLVTGLTTANQNASFKSRVITLLWIFIWDWLLVSSLFRYWKHTGKWNKLKIMWSCHFVYHLTEP